MEEKYGGGGGRTKGIGGGGNTSGLGEEDARSDWTAAARVFDRALRLLSHAAKCRYCPSNTHHDGAPRIEFLP